MKKQIYCEYWIVLLFILIIAVMDFLSRLLSNSSVIAQANSTWFQQYGELRNVPFLLSGTYLLVGVAWILGTIAVVLLYFYFKKKINTIKMSTKLIVSYIVIRPIILLLVLYLDFYNRINPMNSGADITPDMFERATSTMIAQCDFLFDYGLLLTYLPLIVLLFCGFMKKNNQLSITEE